MCPHPTFIFRLRKVHRNMMIAIKGNHVDALLASKEGMTEGHMARRMLDITDHNEDRNGAARNLALLPSCAETNFSNPNRSRNQCSDGCIPADFSHKFHAR
jgi:hypothetical protein